MATKEKVVVRCMWSPACVNEATGLVGSYAFGAVPACGQCTETLGLRPIDPVAARQISSGEPISVGEFEALRVDERAGYLADMHNPDAWPASAWVTRPGEKGGMALCPVEVTE